MTADRISWGRFFLWQQDCTCIRNALNAVTAAFGTFVQEFQMDLTFQSYSVDGKLRFHALLDVENLHKLDSNHDE